jgi:hypothetical protein
MKNCLFLENINEFSFNRVHVAPGDRFLLKFRVDGMGKGQFKY